MQKRYTFLLCSLFYCFVLTESYGQTWPNKDLKKLREHIANLDAGYSEQGGLYKGTGTLERLSGLSYYIHFDTGLFHFDTCGLVYSGTRHSEYDYNKLSFTCEPFYPGYFWSGAQIIQYYDYLNINPCASNIDSGDCLHTTYDTFSHLFHNPGLPDYYATHTIVAFYDAKNRPIDLALREQAPNGNVHHGERYIIRYNTRGHFDRIHQLTYDARNLSQPWDTTYVRNFAYNTQNQLRADSVEFISQGYATLQWRNVYKYDAAGRCIQRARLVPRPSGSLDTVIRHTYSYYTSGKLKTQIYEELDGTPLRLTAKYLDSFGYTAGVPGYTLLLTSYPSTPALHHLIRTDRVASGKKDSITFLTENTPGNYTAYESIRMHYNSNGNPRQKRVYHLRPNYDSVDITNYFYTPYSATSINSHSRQPVIISPNPSTGIISLRFPNQYLNQRSNIEVSDMSGRRIYTYTLSVNSACMQIDLRNKIAPGQYIINVSDAYGNLLTNEKLCFW